MKFTAIFIAATALFASSVIAAEDATCGSPQCHEGFRWVCRHRIHVLLSIINLSSLLTSHNSVILATAVLCATMGATGRAQTE